jgi:hypothetical protein
LGTALECFVTGHDFSRAENANKDKGISPCEISIVAFDLK